MRTWLASVALSAPLTSCCVHDEIWHDRSTNLPYQPDAALAQLIDQCLQTADCEPLCLHDWLDYSVNHYPDADGQVRNCKLTITKEDGRVLTYEGLELCEAGRRPHGYALVPCPATSRVGRYLAAQTALESASVRAFADLVADLIALGAPDELRTASIAAAADEIRHAQICARLARTRGAQITRELIAPAARRRLRDLAIDNAIEGCVRETFAAMVAAYQARTASDGDIRAAMEAIAPDEMRHAELAWEIHVWIIEALTPQERAEVSAAMAAAQSSLLAAAESTLTADERAALGLPDGPAARFMLAALARRTAAV
jgi:hypothetical protein